MDSSDSRLKYDIDNIKSNCMKLSDKVDKLEKEIKELKKGKPK